MATVRTPTRTPSTHAYTQNSLAHCLARWRPGLKHEPFAGMVLGLLVGGGGGQLGGLVAITRGPLDGLARPLGCCSRGAHRLDAVVG